LDALTASDSTDTTPVDSTVIDSIIG